MSNKKKRKKMNVELLRREVNLIKDEALRNKVETILQDIPEVMEHKPSSSSDKYHPDFDRIDGAISTTPRLLSRSLRNWWMAFLLGIMLCTALTQTTSMRLAFFTTCASMAQTPTTRTTLCMSTRSWLAILSEPTIRTWRF